MNRRIFAAGCLTLSMFVALTWSCLVFSVGRRVDFTISPPKIADGFWGRRLNSVPWFFFVGKTLRIHRMSDFSVVHEFKEPVWLLLSVTRSNREELLIGFPDRLVLLSLPDLNEVLNIPLRDRSILERGRPTVFVDDAWLVLVSNGMRTGDNWERYSTVILGWKWSNSLLNHANRVMEPSLRQPIDFDSNSSCRVALDTHKHVLTIHNYDQRWSIDLEASRAERQNSVPLQSSVELADHPSLSIKTNLKLAHWLLAEDGLVTSVQPGMKLDDVNDPSQSYLRFAASYRGIEVFRNTVMPSPVVIWNTWLIPCCCWTLFYVCCRMLEITFPKLALKSIQNLASIVCVLAGIVVFAMWQNRVVNPIGFLPFPIFAIGITALLLLIPAVFLACPLRELGQKIAMTILIAFPLALVFWWLSFLWNSPPNVFTSQVLVALAIAVVGTLSQMGATVRGSAIFGIADSELSRFSYGACILLNCVIAAQISQFVVTVLGNTIIFMDEPQGLAWLILVLLNSISLVLSGISLIVWMIAYSLQALSGQYLPIRSSCSLIILIPFALGFFAFPKEFFLWS